MSRRIDRRQALAAVGTAGLGALFAACGGNDAAEVPASTATPEATASGTRAADRFGDTSACALTPEQTEGPYDVDTDAIRGDIRDGRDGVPLDLAIRVRDASCEPIANAVVDIWHCDAAGQYSTAADPFLRGTQVTDADGIAEFTTIYPGWYQGRTAHIHAKVHLDSATALTTQLYFDEQVTAAVYAQPPYAARSTPDQRNASDGIFDERLLLDLARGGDGYAAAISFDVAAA